MPDSNVPITAGTGTNIDTFATATGEHRQFIIERGYGGGSFRSATPRTPGRAGVVGQKIMTLWNGTASNVIELQFVGIDLYQTVVKAITVAPPVIRLARITAMATGGSSAGTGKVPLDTSFSSYAGVTVTADASADGTLATTALAATTLGTNVLTQEYAPRYITAAGYEPADRIEFLLNGNIIIRPSQGIALYLDYTATTQNPATDMWIGTMQWEELP